MIGRSHVVLWSVRFRKSHMNYVMGGTTTIPLPWAELPFSGSHKNTSLFWLMGLCDIQGWYITWISGGCREIQMSPGTEKIMVKYSPVPSLDLTHWGLNINGECFHCKNLYSRKCIWKCRLRDDIFKCIFLNKNFCILIQNSTKCVPEGPVDNRLTLIQVMAWHPICNKSVPMMIKLCCHMASLDHNELTLAHVTVILF